jgi:hypothetical protein
VPDDSPRGLNPQLKEMSTDSGCASIAPERLLRVLLRQSVHSFRSEHWMLEPFLAEVMKRANTACATSEEPSSFDGTMIGCR